MKKIILVCLAVLTVVSILAGCENKDVVSIFRDFPNYNSFEEFYNSRKIFSGTSALAEVVGFGKEIKVKTDNATDEDLASWTHGYYRSAKMKILKIYDECSYEEGDIIDVYYENKDRIKYQGNDYTTTLEEGDKGFFIIIPIPKENSYPIYKDNRDLYDFYALRGWVPFFDDDNNIINTEILDKKIWGDAKNLSDIERLIQQAQTLAAASSENSVTE